MSESKGERYAFIPGGDERGWYHDSDDHGCLSCSDVVSLLNEHERWRQEREARAHIAVNGEPAVPPHTDSAGLQREFRAWEQASEEDAKKMPPHGTVNGEPASTVDAATMPQTTQTTYACFPCKQEERIDRLEQRFESLDDCVCETDDAVAELRKRIDLCSDQQACHFDAAQAETRMDSLQGQLLALERRLDSAQNLAQAQADNEAEEKAQEKLQAAREQIPKYTVTMGAASLTHLCDSCIHDRGNGPCVNTAIGGCVTQCGKYAKKTAAPAGTQWHDTPQYATAQDVEDLREVVNAGFERMTRMLRDVMARTPARTDEQRIP